MLDRITSMSIINLLPFGIVSMRGGDLHGCYEERWQESQKGWQEEGQEGREEEEEGYRQEEEEGRQEEEEIKFSSNRLDKLVTGTTTTLGYCRETTA